MKPRALRVAFEAEPPGPEQELSEFAAMLESGEPLTLKQRRRIAGLLLTVRGAPKAVRALKPPPALGRPPGPAPDIALAVLVRIELGERPAAAKGAVVKDWRSVEAGTVDDAYRDHIHAARWRLKERLSGAPGGRSAALEELYAELLQARKRRPKVRRK
jgi:hypothetical protein